MVTGESAALYMRYRLVRCYCGKVHNLYAAGRCISVIDDMWDITRAIPCCAVTGQAAGTAAALWEDVRESDMGMLQDRLMTDGVLLHE